MTPYKRFRPAHLRIRTGGLFRLHVGVGAVAAGRSPDQAAGRLPPTAWRRPVLAWLSTPARKAAGAFDTQPFPVGGGDAGLSANGLVRPAARRARELEQAWVRWDKLLLNDAGLRAAIEIAGAADPRIVGNPVPLDVHSRSVRNRRARPYGQRGARGPFLVDVRDGGDLCLRLVSVLSLGAAAHRVSGERTSRVSTRCSGV